MRTLLAALLTLLLLGPAYAQKTKSVLTTEINTNFADNTTGAITPAILRNTTIDMVNSWQQYPGVNAQAGTTYTLTTSDFGQLVTTSNAAAITFNLPQAVGSFSSFAFFAANNGAGTATLTPTTSTICGSATKTIPQGWGVYVVSDGTNWQCVGPFNTASGGGAVTSVGLVMPGVFTVSNSPVISSGTLTATAAGTAGGLVYFPTTTTMASSGAFTANAPILGGGPGAAPVSGARSGNTTTFTTTTGALTNGHCVSIDASGNFVDNGSACGTSSGGVTSVGLTMPAVFTVSNSPLVAAGTLAVTANGTSGGIPYFNAPTTMASTAALTLNAPVIGGGAAGPSVGTRSGNTTAFVTTTGAQTSGHCVSIDASGNHIDSGVVGCAGAGGTPGTPVNSVQFNSAGTFAGISAVTANATNLTAARMTNAASLDWADSGGTTATASISQSAAGVVQFGTGGQNGNGWHQWTGEQRNPTDFPVTNSTSLANVPGLSVTVTSGRIYHFEFDGQVNGTNTGGGQIGFAGTASIGGANTRYSGYCIAGNIVTGGTVNAAINFAPTASNNAYCSIRGTFAPSSTGTITVQFAQSTSNATSSILRANSTLFLWDTP